MIKVVRPQRKTLLAVGEGKAEVAFLAHLRGLYCSKREGVNVTIRDAHGRGPENVVEHAAGIARTAAYDRRLCLLDTDITWTPKALKLAKKSRIDMVGSTPCLEGLLLRCLGQVPPQLSDHCKKQLRQITKEDMTERQHYEQHFSNTVLDAARPQIPEIDRLIRCFEGLYGLSGR